MSRPARTRFFRKRCRATEEFKISPSEIKAPLLANMTEFGKSPLLSFQELARFRLPNGDFSAERVSRFDESKRRIFARSEKARDAIGLGRENADAEGALRVARLRSGGGKLAWYDVEIVNVTLNSVELNDLRFDELREKQI